LKGGVTLINRLFINENNTFNLSRYFSIASLLGIFVFVVASTYLYQTVAVTAFKDHQTRANIDLARSFANSIWPKYKNFILNASQYSVKELQNRIEIEKLSDDLFTQMHGLNVVKIKIYNLGGMIVYSTDAEQL